MWVLSSPTRGWTWAPCSGSSELLPLDSQGIPRRAFFLKVEERLVTKRKGKIKSKHTTPPPPPPPKNLNIKQRCSNEQPEERINLAMLLRLLGTYFWSNLYKRATLVSPLALLCTASLASMQNLTTALRRKTFFGLWASGVLDRAQTTSTGLWGSRYLYLGALALHPPSPRLKVPSTPLSLSALLFLFFYCCF